MCDEMDLGRDSSDLNDDVFINDKNNKENKVEEEKQKKDIFNVDEEDEEDPYSTIYKRNCLLNNHSTDLDNEVNINNPLNTTTTTDGKENQSTIDNNNNVLSPTLHDIQTTVTKNGKQKAVCIYSMVNSIFQL
jgi:hypothetical protein